MPVNTRPNARYEYRFIDDDDDQPVLKLRYLTAAEWADLAEKVDNFQASTKASEMVRMGIEIVRFVSVEGQDDLIDCLTMPELREAVMAATNQNLTDDDKKKLPLPPPSSTAEYAKTVPVKRNAKTRRRK
ncbi:MAG: hypothetical protein JW936_01260 [Sedimentisphaerales bacterium]|nr:hypothetical protein [Sedimentisphaerales bacterium]